MQKDSQNIVTVILDTCCELQTRPVVGQSATSTVCSRDLEASSLTLCDCYHVQYSDDVQQGQGSKPTLEGAQMRLPKNI